MMTAYGRQRLPHAGQMHVSREEGTMTRTRRLLLQATVLLAAATLQLWTAPAAQGAPTVLASCFICDGTGCPLSFERHQECLNQCHIDAPRPACNFWGNDCEPDYGEITCSGDQT
jgi:hypothetical protein